MFNRRTPSWLRFFGSLPIALGFMLLTTAASPQAAAQAPATQSGLHGYWVCYEFNGAGNTDYYSGVFPYAPDNQVEAITGFENYVAITYHEPKRIPTCPFYATEAQAQAALDQHVKIAKNRAVQTGWRPTAAVPSSAASPAPSPSAKPAPAPSTDEVTFSAPSESVYGYCSELAADYTLYITLVFNLEHVTPQKVSGEFHALIQKTYGQNESAYCPAQHSDASVLATARQHDLDDLKRSTPKTRTLKIVMVDWKPTPDLISTAPAPKPANAAPRPTPALDAYQQALAAQRPNGVAAAETMFCYADGAQRGGGGQAQIYVSKVFAAASTAQVGSAFQVYLRGAHPDVIISTATCPMAQDADTLQGTRQEYIENQRKISTRNVVEVDWKGGQ